MDLIRSFIAVIIICCILGAVFYLIPPSEETQSYHYYLTVNTHGIDIYFLTIETDIWQESVTVVDYVYSTRLSLGEYYIEACYYNVNNTMKCESQRVWLDENLEIDFFVGVIE